MKILICNNSVRYGSGIDAIVRIEHNCLVDAGHQVTLFEKSNSDFGSAPIIEKTRMLISTLYSTSTRRAIDKILSDSPFDLVHIHNTVPFLTGAVYDACRKHAKVMIVQSLHNYRAFCLSSYSFRNNAACDQCRSTAFLSCAVHGCYRNSRAQSAGMVLSRWIDCARGRKSGMDADTYIAVSEFVRQRYMKEGMPANRIRTLLNASPDLSSISGTDAPTDQLPEKKFVYVGSLAAAKGIFTLCELALNLNDFEFHVVGTGDDSERFRRRIAELEIRNIVLHGFKSGEEKVHIWSHAFLTIVPSLWDEPFGLVATESFSLGIPVVTTGPGALSEIVEDGKNGLISSFNDLAKLATLIKGLWADTQTYSHLCKEARATYELLYSVPAYSRRLCQFMENIVSQNSTRAKGGIQ